MIHAAIDLQGDAELRRDRWVCPGCQTAMTPAAVNPHETFKVVPYFRASGAHKRGCTAEGVFSAVHPKPRQSTKQREALSAMAPTVLHLPSLRLQVADGGQVGVGAVGGRENHHSNCTTTGEATKNPVRTTTSLALIARHYAMVGPQKSDPLRISGVTGTNYGECIEPLRSFDVQEPAPPRQRFRIAHAPVAFRDGIPLNGPITVTLHRGALQKPDGENTENKRAKLAVRYQVIFETRDWPEQQVQAIRRNALAWIEEQKKLALQGDKLEIHLFFLGLQSDDGLSFVVSDWRLACFQSMLKGGTV